MATREPPSVVTATPTPAPRLRASVIVPVRQGGAPFARCLASLVAALGEQDELIVVADGEGDGAWRAAEGFPGGARVVRLPAAGGPARARNAGARAAAGEWLFFVDADVAVPPDCLERIARAFAADEGLAALIGSYDRSPGARDFLSQYKNLFHHHVHQQHGAGEAATFWGACGAIRRSVFLAVGGFDEQRYARPCVEDIELGYRLRAAGHRVRLDPALQVTHWKRWTPWSLLKADTFDRAAPWTELILDQRLQRGKAVADDLNLGWTYRASTAVSGLLAGSLAGAWLLTPWLLGLSALLAMVFVGLHRSLFGFFRRERGWRFLAAAIPWRFGYDVCSAVGFGWGATRFAGGAVARARARLAAAMATAGEVRRWELDA